MIDKAPTQTVAVTKVLPDSCPACGLLFGVTDATGVGSHFLGHIMMQIGGQGRDITKSDW